MPPNTYLSTEALCSSRSSPISEERKSVRRIFVASGGSNCRGLGSRTSTISQEDAPAALPMIFAVKLPRSLTDKHLRREVADNASIAALLRRQPPAARLRRAKISALRENALPLLGDCRKLGRLDDGAEHAPASNLVLSGMCFDFKDKKAAFVGDEPSLGANVSAGAHGFEVVNFDTRADGDGAGR